MPKVPTLILSLSNWTVPGKWYPILDQNSLISIPYPRLNCSKTLPFTAAHIPIKLIYGGTPPPGRFRSFLVQYTLRSYKTLAPDWKCCLSHTGGLMRQDRFLEFVRDAKMRTWFFSYIMWEHSSQFWAKTVENSLHSLSNSGKKSKTVSDVLPV